MEARAPSLQGVQIGGSSADRRLEVAVGAQGNLTLQSFSSDEEGVSERLEFVLDALGSDEPGIQS